jgi:hypothetical protein
MVFWQLIFSPPDTKSKLHATAKKKDNILFYLFFSRMTSLSFVVFATIHWLFSPHIPQEFNKARPSWCWHIGFDGKVIIQAGLSVGRQATCPKRILSLPKDDRQFKTM